MSNLTPDEFEPVLLLEKKLRNVYQLIMGLGEIKQQTNAGPMSNLTPENLVLLEKNAWYQ